MSKISKFEQQSPSREWELAKVKTETQLSSEWAQRSQLQSLWVALLVVLDCVENVSLKMSCHKSTLFIIYIHVIISNFCFFVILYLGLNIDEH